MIELEIVLMLVMVYIVGLLSMMFFNKYRAGSTAQPFVEYEHRFKEYEDMLVDLKIRLDMMELRASSDVSQISHEISDVSRDVNHGAKVIQRNLEQEGKGLVDYVLKLLAEGPKTSRQIEIVIGRTREHTARLMKKLFELGYVTRDTATKPYTYSITEVGRAVLQQVASVNP